MSRADGPRGGEGESVKVEFARRGENEDGAGD